MRRLQTSASFGSLVLCLIALGAATACNRRPSDDAIKTLTVYDLLAAYPRARPANDKPGSVNQSNFDVGGDLRPGILLHPPTRLSFGPIHLGAESVLNFKIGIMGTAWEEAGDGVEFFVLLSSATDPEQKIYSRYIDPKNKPEDRRWFEEHVPLTAYSDRDVTITLYTEAGPANDFTADWAVFAEPQIVLSGNP